MGRLPITSCSATHVEIDGREILSFGGCNYLGLADHPAVHASIAKGLKRYGVSTTASRETTGNTLAHEELERELAEFTGQEHAILSAEGYTANFMACQVLGRSHGVALVDAQTHRSVRHAASAGGMQVFDYEHLNAESAAWLAARHADQGVVILTDTVFAADGAIAPLPELLGALPVRRGTLLADDCHGFCVLGRGGRGALSHFGLDDPRIVMTTTLAKGLGCYGGAVLGRRAFIDEVQKSAWVYRSSTPVPPAIAQACRTALGLLRADEALVSGLRANIGGVRKVFARLGLPLPPEGVPIFTFTLATHARMQRVHELLHEAGVLAPLIDYPGGPAPLYFRIVVNAMHTQEQIDRLGAELTKALASTEQMPNLAVG